MRFPPPEVLLSWPTPNYTDPVTKGPALLIVNCVFISLAILFVGARLYTRIWIKSWFGLDDVFIILATLFTIGLTAAVLLANQQYGWDRHIYDIPFTKFEPNLKIAFAAKFLFTAATTFTRLSLLTFYYRLLKDSRKLAFRWLVHLNVVYSVAIFVTFTLLVIFLCVPVHAYWTIGEPPDACLNEGTVMLAAGIINVTADFACTLTPIPLVIKLQMPRRQRVAVIFLFSLGFLVTIVGCVRTWYIYKSLVLEYDQTWYAYPLWMAAAIEIDLGVICASAPVFRSLLTSLFNPSPLSRSLATSAQTTLAANSSKPNFTPLSAGVLLPSNRRPDSGYEMRTWPTPPSSRPHSHSQRPQSQLSPTIRLVTSEDAIRQAAGAEGIPAHLS